MSFDKALASFPFNSGYRWVKTVFGSMRKSERILIQIHKEIEGILEGIEPGVEYSCEELCGPEIWSRYASVGQRRALGIILHHLVDEGVLPLVCATRGSSNRRYRLSEREMRSISDLNANVSTAT